MLKMNKASVALWEVAHRGGRLFEGAPLVKIFEGRPCIKFNSTRFGGIYCHIYVVR